MKLWRMIQIEARIQAGMEKKYARLIGEAIAAQGEHFKKHKEIDNSLYPVIEQLYREAFEFWIPRQWNQLEKGLITKRERFFDQEWIRWTQQYTMEKLLKKVTNIDETTRKQLKEAVAEGASRGLTYGQMEDLVDEYTKGKIGKARARMIARTESGQSINTAKNEAATKWEQEQDLGFKLGKLWMHRGAKNPRDWHMYLDNGVAIPKDIPFQVMHPKGGVEEMMYPHSEGASPENTINCGCQVIYVRYKEGEQWKI